MLLLRIVHDCRGLNLAPGPVMVPETISLIPIARVTPIYGGAEGSNYVPPRTHAAYGIRGT